MQNRGLTKRCCQCLELKLYADFHRRKLSKDGRVSACVACLKRSVKIDRRENPNKYKTRAKAYRRKNQDVCLGNERKYYAANREKCCQRSRTYRKMHREQVKTYNRRYHEKHRDKLNADSRQWHRENPERSKTNHLGYLLRVKYGLSIETFKQMCEKQDNRCAICDQNKPLCVDHCHTQGIVRGLLCINCNYSLGGFYDNVAYLKNAIRYLGQ